MKVYPGFQRRLANRPPLGSWLRAYYRAENGLERVGREFSKALFGIAPERKP